MRIQSSSVEVRLGALALFVDGRAAMEAVEPEPRRIYVRLVASNQMGKDEAGRGRGLEAAITPACVEIEPLDRCAVDDWRAVHRHVREAGPLAQQPEATDHRHQRHAA